MSYTGLHRVKRGEKYTANIIYVLDYTSVAPVHGAFEEAEALASLYGIHLNSNRPLWQVKLVLYRYSCATEICQSPLLRKEVKLMDATRSQYWSQKTSYMSY